MNARSFLRTSEIDRCSSFPGALRCHMLRTRISRFAFQFEQTVQKLFPERCMANERHKQSRHICITAKFCRHQWIACRAEDARPFLALCVATCSEPELQGLHSNSNKLCTNSFRNVAWRMTYSNRGMSATASLLLPLHFCCRFKSATDLLLAPLHFRNF